jgi:hypothetical protein
MILVFISQKNMLKNGQISIHYVSYDWRLNKTK